MKLTKSIIAAISILAVSVSVLAQQPPPPPGGPGGPPPGGPGGPPPGGPGGPPPGGPGGSPPGGPGGPPPGGPGGPPPGGPGGPPPGGTAGTGGPADGPDDDHDDEMPSKEEIIAAVGPACAQYVPDEPPSDPATFIAAVPDSCKSVFSQLMDD